MERAASRVDVAILGAGIAGIACARALRERDAALRVVVLERSRVGAGAAGMASGLVLAGLAPDPAAVARAIGAKNAAASQRLAERNASALLELAKTLGVACRAIGLPDRGATDLQLDAAALLAALARDVDVREGWFVRALEPIADGVRVVADGFALEASRAVIALGAGSHGFDAWLRELSLPAAAKSLVTEPLARRIAPHVVAGGQAQLSQDGEGRLWIEEGCQPSNRGDAFDASVPADLEAKLVAYATEKLGAPPPPIARRQSRALLYTCDGLPLVGPHPGRESALLCTGFNGMDWSFGWIAGGIAAQWLLDGRPRDADASLFSPRRML